MRLGACTGTYQWYHHQRPAYCTHQSELGHVHKPALGAVQSAALAATLSALLSSCTACSVSVLLVLLGRCLLSWRLLCGRSRVRAISAHWLLIGLARRRGGIDGRRRGSGCSSGGLRRLAGVGLLGGIGAVGGSSSGRADWRGCRGRGLLRPCLRWLLPGLLLRVRCMLLVAVGVVARLSSGGSTPARGAAIVAMLRRGGTPARRLGAPAGVRAARRRHVQGWGA